MIFSKKATSIIEAMIVLLIIVTGVVGMYKVYGDSQKLSSSTANKIQAIQIAREGIEAVKNIRDTNWILYGADTKNCWNTDGYNSSCVGQNNSSFDIAASGTDGYILLRNSDNRWQLSKTGSSVSWNSTYRNDFEVFTDTNGFFTQTGVLNTSKFTIAPLFTREIKIEYFQADGVTAGTSDDPKMKVTSLVQWADGANTSSPHNVEFTAMLSNWQK